MSVDIMTEKGASWSVCSGRTVRLLLRIAGYALVMPFAIVGFWASICIQVFETIDRDFDEYMRRKRYGDEKPNKQGSETREARSL